MACLHKFHEYLHLEKLDFEPTTLIVGTFNPAWPAENTAQWFYGRTHDAKGKQNNNFWDVLPRLYGERSLINGTPHEWKRFCKYHRIAITDLIYSIDDAMDNNIEHEHILRTYSDGHIATKFSEHSPVVITDLLITHPSIKHVYFTRGTGEPFWSKRWKPVVKHTLQNNIYEAKLLTPSGYAFYQQGRWNNRNPKERVEVLSDFILKSWQAKWHEIMH